MSVQELAYHVYQVTHVLGRAVEAGGYAVDVLEEIPFEPAAVRTAEELLAYGRRLRPPLTRLADGVTEAQLRAAIRGGGRATATGMACVDVMLQEAMHHRGQLMLCLRLMGRQPPPLYS